MVLIAFEHRLCTIDDRSQPFRLVARHGAFHIKAIHLLPRAMRFEVRFIDDVQTVAVAQLIPRGAVRIMAGTHGIDVILLHHACVIFHFFIRKRNNIAFSVSINTFRCFTNSIFR